MRLPDRSRASGDAKGNLRRQLVRIRSVRKRGYTVRVLRTSRCDAMSAKLRIETIIDNHDNGSVRAAIRTERIDMKKIGFLTLLIMGALLFTLTFAFPAAAAAPKAPAIPVAAAPAAPAAAAMPEAHPHIDEALEAMRSAKKHLEIAEHDFKGHRAKALQHLQMAIREAEICMSEK